MGIVECACTPRKAPASAQCARCRSRHSTRLTKRRTSELRSPRASSVDPLGDLRRSATTGTPCAAAGHGPKGGILAFLLPFSTLQEQSSGSSDR